MNLCAAMKLSRFDLRRCLLGLLLPFALGGICHAQSFVRIESEAQSQARERIEAALSRIGTADYLDTPLKAVAADLRDRLGVSVVLASSKLADAAITNDTPVTSHISGVSYRSLLRLILQELKLTWTIRDEVILITTSEDAESMLETRLYPVLDLVAVAGATPEKAVRDEHDYDTLIDAITTTVDPDSWEEVGGPGTVAKYPGAGALLVTQTGEVHEKVEQILAAVRRVKGIQGISHRSAPSARKDRLRKMGTTSTVTPRRYATTPSAAWQLPQVHVAE